MAFQYNTPYGKIERCNTRPDECETADDKEGLLPKEENTIKRDQQL